MDEIARELATAEGWKTSSYTGDGENCVEVNTTLPWVGVRDTKQRDGGVLVFSRTAWSDLLSAVRQGKLDLP